MCGIAGFVQRSASSDELASIAQKMGDALQHRGPDDHGVYIDEKKRLAFAHRRLSIVDLSPLGHQPYISDDGMYALTYNGEIYNHLEIKAELTALGQTFKSHSDTEVLMKAIMTWGIHDTLRRCNGMFAFAFYDKKWDILNLVRDRMGVKPLYEYHKDDLHIFASELKAMQQHPDFNPAIDRRNLLGYFRMGFWPKNNSIYRNVRQVQIPSVDSIGTGSWWSLPSGPSRNTTTIPDIHDALKKAVGLRMVADVPVGVMLSGGIDSSLVTALMQAQSDRPIKSFSIGFSESAYNEAPHAEKIAAHLGTEHRTLTFSSRDAQALIPQLCDIYDEPFGDSSALPSLILSKLIREHVTVALSGDGGDEVFLGYNRYAYFSKLQQYRKLPMAIRKIAGSLLGMLPFETKLKDKVTKFTQAGLAGNIGDMYVDIFGGWPASLMPDERFEIWGESDDLETLQRLDFKHYLPGDILTKVDRASMAYGLEVRNPFLDFNVVEAAYHLPQNLKLNGNVTKYALRQILAHYVPKPLFERPKAGFAIPLAQWLRGDLRDWANDLLSSKALSDLGYIDHKLVIGTWHEFLKGRDSHMHRLWSMLMFAGWLQKNKGEKK